MIDETKKANRITRFIRRQRRKLRRWVCKYKMKHGCKKCGYKKHPAALGFHHRRRSQKRFGIASAVSRGMALETIKKEVKKCDVLCANCHIVLESRKFRRVKAW